MPDVGPSGLGLLVHQYAPHSGVALYYAACVSSLMFVLAVWGRCMFTKAHGHLEEKWIFATAAAAAPIPTYALLLVVPFDPDLAHSVLDDRVVVALAGLYGLIETLKDIRGVASAARRRKDSSRHSKAEAEPKPD